MRLRGLVRSAELQEYPPGSDVIEMVLRVQGVGPGQPRTILVPFVLLIDDPDLDPEAIRGHGFEADVEQDEANRWVATTIAFAGRNLLRPEE